MDDLSKIYRIRSKIQNEVRATPNDEMQLQPERRKKNFTHQNYLSHRGILRNYCQPQLNR